VAGDQDCQAFGGQRPEQAAYPADSLRVQAVQRLVEHQHGRVSQQRRGDAETLRHAERELPGPFARNGLQSG
jgi:hypothetical protein